MCSSHSPAAAPDYCLDSPNSVDFARRLFKTGKFPRIDAHDFAIWDYEENKKNLTKSELHTFRSIFCEKIGGVVDSWHRELVIMHGDLVQRRNRSNDELALFRRVTEELRPLNAASQALRQRASRPAVTTLIVGPAIEHFLLLRDMEVIEEKVFDLCFLAEKSPVSQAKGDIYVAITSSFEETKLRNGLLSNR